MGMVDKVADYGVLTIEGNTSPETGDLEFVDRDGDGYYPKVRHWAELGTKGGFIALDF